MTLEWDEVGHLADRFFNIWSSGGDLEWAETAWGFLAKAGLTDDSNGLEHCKTLVRLLCLAEYYYTACTLYLDEDVETDLTAWAEELDISAVRLGQLIGPDFIFGSSEDSSTLYKEALTDLMAELEDEVEKALLKGYGGKDRLFVALCRSRMTEESCDPEHPDYKTDNQVLRENSASYMAFLS